MSRLGRGEIFALCALRSAHVGALNTVSRCSESRRKSLMLRPFFILIVAACLLSGLAQCSSGEVRHAVELPLGEFRAGDIIFRRGEGMTSDFVAFNDPEGEYSHVGMIISTDSGLMAVHALPGSHPTQAGEDLVRAETLQEFFAPENALYGKVMRLPMRDAQRAELSQRALEKVAQRVEFDHDYDDKDTVRLYCTELLQLLYSHVGIDLAEGRITSISVPGVHADVIMPADVHRNSLLTPIFSY